MTVDEDVEANSVDEGRCTGKKEFGDGLGEVAYVVLPEYIHQSLFSPHGEEYR